MKADDKTLDTCGCCEGIGPLTPESLRNPPGLSAVAYRVGTHASFKETMKARLAGGGALSGLATRDDDDPSIALLDAWATVADVLTFYQERIASEGYLRTATERQSVLELARSLGYELKPGVAASTYLAFELETAPGSPGFATIDVGTKVQSLPRPGEKPQTFETIEKIEARSAWNAMGPKLTRLRFPVSGDQSLYLVGISTNLKPGDPLLIVGPARERSRDRQQWELRRVAGVEPDAKANRTLIRLDKRLSRIPSVEPSEKGPKVYALRTRAALFGHNAQEWKALPAALRDNTEGAYKDRENDWADHPFSKRATTINLDAVYTQVVLNSWIVLASPTHEELYRVTGVGEETKADFNITGKTTRLEISGENIDEFSARNATVYTQSEELKMAEAPIVKPVSGQEIVLDRVVEGLERGQQLLVTGRRVRAPLRRAPTLEAVEGGTRTELGSSPKGIPIPDLTGVRLLPPVVDGKTTTEVVELREAVPEGDRYTKLILAEPLDHAYDRASVVIRANVAAATHGETRREVLGSGDASQGFQKFVLKQTPLTYVSAPTPSGTASSLQVRVNKVLWDEVASLYGSGPRQQVHTTRLADDGKAAVQFGDGLTGSRLPSGVENVEAKYRVGIGLAGNVKAEQLSLLMTRPLGVKGVLNPLPATGGADPEERDQARENAPLTVLTLDRVVSRQDYEDFARGFAGIGKAQATLLWRGETRFVHITLAAAGGGKVDVGTALYRNLERALALAGDLHQRFDLASYEPLPFHVEARIQVDRRHLPEKVLGDAFAALEEAFSFPQRALARPVTASEVLAVIQGVGGVEAVDLDALYIDHEQPGPNPFLPAERARWDQGTVRPAQLLTLLPSGVDLEEMV